MAARSASAVGGSGGGRAATASPGGLRASRSMSGFGGSKGRLHHRGEGSTGLVRGFEHTNEDFYVPRAMWTESNASPMKHRTDEFDAQRFLDEGKAAQMQRKSMTHMLRRELGRQVEDRGGFKKTKDVQIEMELRASTADVARRVKEESFEKEERKKNDKAFREGLDEQAAHNVRRAMEGRLREAHEAAEIKLRTTQQLCEELTQASRQKEARKREFVEGMKETEAKRLVQRAEKQREQEELRRTLRDSFSQEGERDVARQARVKEAMASQEMCYKNYADTTGFEERARYAKEGRRQDRDEQHHQLRTDMMYAQREMARERQRQRVRQTLDDQVDAKMKKTGTVRIQQDYELRSVNQATRMSMESELAKIKAKKAEELENQAALVAQMAENQQRRKAENGPHHRPIAATSTMTVTPALMASAEGWRTGAGSLGKSASAPDITQRLDASMHLSKPMGKPEVKPWVDIAKSFGPGGVVGVFGGDGPTRSALMMTGGPTRLLNKSRDIVAQDKAMRKTWHDGLSPEDLKSGRKAAARRRDAAIADKALVPA